MPDAAGQSPEIQPADRSVGRPSAGADAAAQPAPAPVSGAGDRAGPADRSDPEVPQAGAWHLRVVGHELVAPSDLINHPDNFRGHPSAQREALEAAIEEVGFVGEVLVSRRSGRILDGHLRVAEALRSGQPVVPVGWVDCQSDEDEAAILATHDPIGAMATADRAKLVALAEKAQVQADPLKAMLAVMAAKVPQPSGTADGTPPPAGGHSMAPPSGGRLGQVGDLIYPVVVECATEEDAEVLLEMLTDEGHSAYLMTASPSSAPRDEPWS